jgi:ABC-2 type transport system ATP-binding protein
LQEPLKVKAQVGYMAENMGIYADLTARESLKFIAGLNGLKNSASDIEECLHSVGLTGVADKKAGTFSRGMRQRLGLAEVLLKKPRLAFFDEPTLGLDPEGIATMMELISVLPQERGLSIILSSHLLHLVAKVAHRVGILHQGRLLAMGSIPHLAELTGCTADLEAIYRHYLRQEATNSAEKDVSLARMAVEAVSLGKNSDPPPEANS